MPFLAMPFAPFQAEKSLHFQIASAHRKFWCRFKNRQRISRKIADKSQCCLGRRMKISVFPRFLKTCRGAPPEVENPPRASRRRIAPQRLLGVTSVLGVASALGIPTGKPPRGPLRGSGFFSGSGLVVPLHCCTSISLRVSTSQRFRDIYASDFLFFPYNPTPPPIPTNPPPVPPPKLDFGPFRLRFDPFRLRFGPFSSVFWVCFGSVSGC